MSIDQYAFPFKHISPLEYATIRPAIVATFDGGSEKARLVLMSIPVNKKTLASGRRTVELYEPFCWPAMSAERWLA